MRLSRVKLVGFKSFVDPTTFHLTGRLNGIVGPNGCGKSNIIDAVRWVMGESSAKQLRGESMSDVIFNGSAHRKPAGMATIELVFDNRKGELGGKWAAFSEISIRRLLDREGRSQYFLNGSRCRRRDITDIFMGTGLGPRSYAIIEQGMISRIVESKPDELRIFFEEAANISKYKEQRRETERRINNTRDNLSRLTDIRIELNTQFEHLKGQAERAQQYQTLKMEERELNYQIIYTERTQLQEELSRLESIGAEAGKELEEIVEGYNSAVEELHQKRGAIKEQERATKKIRGAYYQLKEQITTLTHKITLTKSLQEQQQAQQQEWLQEIEHLTEEISEEGKVLSQLKTQQEEQRLQLEECEVQVMVAQEALFPLEEALIREEQGLQMLQQKKHTLKADERGLEGELRILQEQLLRLRSQRSSKECIEEQAIDKEMLVMLTEKVEGERVELLELTQQSSTLQEQSLAHQKRYQESEMKRAQLEQNISAVEGQLATLAELRASRSIEAENPLHQCLVIDEEWSRAFDHLLERWLSLEIREESLEQSQESGIHLTERGGSYAPNQLGYHLKSDHSLHSLLGHVYTVTDEEIAQIPTLRASLRPHEILVTQAGDLFGIDWQIYYRDRYQKESHLTEEARHQQLLDEHQALKEQLLKIIEQQKELRTEGDRLIREKMITEEAIEMSQEAFHDAERALALAELEIKHHEAQKLTESKVESDREKERVRLEGSVAQLEEQLTLIAVEEEMVEEQIEAATEQLAEVKEQLNRGKEYYQRVDRASKERGQQLQQLNFKIEQLEDNLKKRKEELTRLKKRSQRENSSDVEYLKEKEEALIEAQQELTLIEEEALAAEASLQSLQREIEECEERQKRYGKHLESERERIQNYALKEQALKTKLELVEERWQTLLYNLNAEEKQTLKERCNHLKPLSIAPLRVKLKEVVNEIKALGAVNLVAIEEARQLKERKEYLDKQDADLNEALASLEEAIAKIDRETKERFMETFNAVNSGFRELFPKLFGGGNAHLELTESDELLSGVNIIAHPPGKRPGTIHLLSGGEKALTAMALIFSIFNLNPAPFCMLDEVDAPLDEANVHRLGRLLNSMSEKVQFIFITHNKNTMSISDALIGVTMAEPGVSRLVSVNLEEALRYSE